MEEEQMPSACDETQCVPSWMPGERRAPAAVVVAGDPGLRRATALYLRLVGGYSVLAAGSVQQALDHCGDFGPSLLLLHAERSVPGPGPQLRAWRERVGAPAVVLSSEDGAGELRALRALGASDVVPIPADPDRLMELLACVLGAHASQR